MSSPSRVSGKKIVRNLVILAIAGALAAMVPRHFSVSKTASVNYRVFFLNIYADKFPRDQYIVFRLPSDCKYYPDKVLVKRVVAVPGDVMTMDGESFFLNGKYLTKGKGFTLKGEPLPAKRLEGEIPAGKVFVLGEKKDSYDSRYFGLVDKSQIMGTAYGIL